MADMKYEPRQYGFESNLLWSKNGTDHEREIEGIRHYFPEAAIQILNTNGNDGGADYLANLPGGRVIRIDAKRRREGCSSYWTDGEELALETWSDIEHHKVGWTLDVTKATEYVLFTFSPKDSQRQFLLAFQQLRRVFTENQGEWAQQYRVREQSSGRWHSECVFIPARVVRAAMFRAEVARL